MNRTTVLLVAAAAATILLPAVVCIGVPSVLAGVVGVDLVWSTPGTATVEAKRWTRTIEVQRWDRVERSDWCADVPDGAEVIARENRTPARTSHQRRTHRHRTPRPWCTFRIDEWTADEPRVAEGTDEPRVWPEAPSPDACGPAPAIGCLRASTAVETLFLGLVPAEREPVECPVPETAWTGHAVGDRVDLPLSRVFRRPLCAEIE